MRPAPPMVSPGARPRGRARLAGWWLARPEWVRAGMLGLVAFVLYAARLDHVPPYLVHDEVAFALNAHSVATTGRGLAGERLPLYFHVGGPFWSTPWVVYFPALFLTVLPPSTAVIRVPTALLGALVVGLTYLAARRLLRREDAALGAALLLAMTPAHMIHSRLGVDHLYPLPFVLGWLLCVLAFHAHGRWRHLFASGVLLGLGVYSYMASLVTMPLLAGITVACVCLTRPEPLRASATFAAGFVLPLTLLVPWLLSHPEQVGQQLSMYSLAGAGEPGEAVRSLARHFSYPRMTEHARVWHEFFNPSFLFFSGDPSVINSTRTAGVFLFALAVLIPIGINEIVNTRRSRLTLLVLAAFLTAPAAGVLVGEVKVNRALTLVPLGVLIGAFGLERLLSSPVRWPRRLAAILLVAAGLQFAWFAADYFTGYRARSSPWFEGNRRGAFDLVLAAEREGTVDEVFLDDAVPWLREHWQLYLIEHRRPTLLARTREVPLDRLEPATGTSGGIVVGWTERLTPQAEVSLRGSRRWVDVPEAGGGSMYFVAGPVARAR